MPYISNINRAESRLITRKNAASSYYTVRGENIQFVRFNPYQKGISIIGFLTYRTSIEIINAQEGWQYVGDFGLTNDNGEAFQRLKGSAIHNKWLKYNDEAK